MQHDHEGHSVSFGLRSYSPPNPSKIKWDLSSMDICYSILSISQSPLFAIHLTLEKVLRSTVHNCMINVILRINCLMVVFFLNSVLKRIGKVEIHSLLRNRWVYEVYPLQPLFKNVSAVVIELEVLFAPLNVLFILALFRC